MSISKYTAPFAVFVIIIILFILSQNDLVSSEPLQNISTACRTNTTFVAFQMNLRKALTRLTNTAAANATFSNTTVGPDKVFALYYCTGNVTAERCGACVQAAAGVVLKNCNNYTEGMAWSYDCTLWYADWMIFGAEDGKIASSEIYPTYFGSYDYRKIAHGREVAEKTTEELNLAAANNTTGDPPGFAMTELAVSSNETLVALAQCAPGVTGNPCLRCLRNATGFWSKCCSGEYMGYRSLIFQPSCRLQLSIEVAPPPPGVDSTSTSPSNTSIIGTISRSGGEMLNYSKNNVIGAIALTFFAVYVDFINLLIY